VCQPEHAVPDDASEKQSKLAVESRAYPLMVFDPDAGKTWEECLSLEGNPALDEDWPTYKLEYEDEDGNAESMELPMTFADFALTEGRFRKHFRMAPRDSWNENMVPIAEFLQLSEEDREGMYPYVWGVDKKNQLMRVICSAELVASTEERLGNWITLKGLAGLLGKVDPDEIANKVRSETAGKLAASLYAMLGGSGAAPALDLAGGAAPAAAAEGVAPAAADAAGFEAAWVEAPLCTTCDECIDINPKIFQYNADKKATVINPKGGPYKDIVRSAEKCPADCIHPGTPWDPSEKGLDKLVKRAEKYQ
jgi:pyruvate-ferredoxin/flavodoxin oxidoreductase